jgi:hypothetical protein
LIAVAILYKKLRSPFPDGFQGYFTVLIIGGMVPSASLLPTVRRFINWRAFSLALFMILLIILFWEATLAVPYGWWRYRSERIWACLLGHGQACPLRQSPCGSRSPMAR